MNPLFKIAFALSLISGIYTLAHADEKQSEARGQLLYLTNCNACHTTQIHWREQKLVTDWNSLLQQIRRWQRIADLKWSEEEINDVAHYLNTLFYSYKDTGQGNESGRLWFRQQK
jgi:mono/diheme cytochrome c family protein